MADRPEILLITENKTVLLELGHDGKFSAKSTGWEENRVFLQGEELVIRVEGGRWFITKQTVNAGAAEEAPGGEEVLFAKAPLFQQRQGHSELPSWQTVNEKYYAFCESIRSQPFVAI